MGSTIKSPDNNLMIVCTMEVKILFCLAVLGLVSLPAVSATAQQQQGEWCESCHSMKVLNAISIDLTLRGTVCH